MNVPTALQPPEWLRSLAHQNKAAWPVGRSIRIALAVGVPLIVATVVDHKTVGLMAAIGGMLAVVPEKDQPYPLRLRKVAVGAAMGMAGYVAVALLPQQPVVTISAITGVAFLAGIVSSWSAQASAGALQMVVLASLAPHLAPIAGPWIVPLGFGVGALWAMLLLAAEFALRGHSPDRQLVADYLTATAGLAEAIATDNASTTTTLAESETVAQARRSVTAARSAAYAALLRRRAHGQGRSRDSDQQALILAAVGDVATQLMVQAATVDPASAASWSSWLRQAAAAAETGSPAPIGPVAGTDRMAMLFTHLGAALRQTKVTTPAARPPETGIRERLHDRFLVGPAVVIAAGRLALCMAVASVLAAFIDGRSYWIPLTVAIVMKPDFGSVFVRAVHRSVGTAIGVVIGAGILAVVPKGVWFIVVIVALVACLPWAAARSYAMASVVITPMVVVLIDYALPGPSVDLGAQRLLDTALGSMVVLVFGYLIWSDTRRSDVSASFTVALSAVADYLQRLGEPGVTTASTRGLRHRAYRELSDLRTQLQRALAEPPPASRLAATWFPAVAAAERVTDRITVLAADGGFAPAQVQQRVDELRQWGRSASGADDIVPAAGDVAALDLELARLRRSVEAVPVAGS